MGNKEKTSEKLKNIINSERLHEEIRERAKQIFLKRGTGEGDAISDWLQAEKEIKKKYKLK